MHQRLDARVDADIVLGAATDDQRRARLVDQDRVHLIDDGVVQAALYAVRRLIDHVVAQVVKAVFGIGAVGDVAAVSGLLLALAHIRQVAAHR